MNNEWINLTTGKEVFDRQAEGWEIEVKWGTSWHTWDGNGWVMHAQYRGRPKQPKPKIVTSECWRHKNNGGLTWGRHVDTTSWQRFPAGDITGEVEE
jgi:hypothetical protein